MFMDIATMEAHDDYFIRKANTTGTFGFSHLQKAYNLSTDHKQELEGDKERILNAGGFIVAGCVNGSLNLARAIGDMELKQNELLPAERQIVTTEPEFKTERQLLI